MNIFKLSLSRRTIMVLCSILLIIPALAFTSCIDSVYAAVASNQQKAVLHDLQDAFTSIVDQVLPSVVSITSERTIKKPSSDDQSDQDDDTLKEFPFPFPMPMPAPDQQSPQSMGTGVIIRSDGYILTNDHVVGDADKVKVTLQNGKSYPGTVFRDSRGDLAVIKINAKDLPAAKLGDSDKVKVGSWSIAIGSPFGYDQTVTVGIISGTGRQADVSGEGVERYYPNLLQTDASINPGNSGGPLVNIDGEVIGINTLIRSTFGGGNVGIGFAIPSNTAKFIMDQLISRGKVIRGFLGIQPDDLSPDQKDTYGVTEGALVRSVEEGSPADSAGIQVEDVIIEIGGKKISGQIQLRDVIASAQPGKEIPIVVIREKQKKTLNVTLKEAETTVAGNKPDATVNTLGFTVGAITPELAEKYDIAPKTVGVVITKVTSGSSAMKAGLQAGLVVTKINNKPIKSEADFNESAKGLKSGDSVRLVIKAKERTILVSFELD